MTNWEYRHTSASTPLPELNALGADGWEVVGQTDTVEHVRGGRVEERVWLLRRPTRDASAVTGD